MNSAYNSDENEIWKNYKYEIKNPNPSECSFDKFDLYE
jgi:hypothetical protein